MDRVVAAESVKRVGSRPPDAAIFAVFDRNGGLHHLRKGCRVRDYSARSPGFGGVEHFRHRRIAASDKKGHSS